MTRLLAPAGLLVLLAGCGDDATIRSEGVDKPRLVVSAASSMNEALSACAPEFPDAEVGLQFAGSDELAGQIRQGAPVDVFAAASAKLAEALAQEGKLEPPVEFATNRLVLAVPADTTKVTGLKSLEARGVKLVIGAEGVPVGDYTRGVLEQLGPDRRDTVLANVRSNGRTPRASSASSHRAPPTDRPARDLRPLRDRFHRGAGALRGARGGVGGHPPLREEVFSELRPPCPGRLILARRGTALALRSAGPGATGGAGSARSRFAIKSSSAPSVSQSTPAGRPFQASGGRDSRTPARLANTCMIRQLPKSCMSTG